MNGQPKMPQPSRSKVFISYSHKDKKHLERLQVHLEPYRRAGIDVWDDTKIRPGQRWRQEIAGALASVKIAILLVSADFMASTFIVDHELPSLLFATQSGGATILPVVVSACNFGESGLAEFQAINDPSKPVDSLTRHKREAIWTRVAKVVADTLAGPLYAEIGREAEANLGSKVESGQQTVLGDELDTLIALQETLKNAPKDTHFPYFVRPLGPLFAVNEGDLRKAAGIRRQVIHMFIEEADKVLTPGDKTSDHYHGYKAQIAYLRSMFDAEQWLRFASYNDTMDVMLEIAEELVPLLPLIPTTEAECYEQEQIAVAEVRHFASRLGARHVSAFRSG